MATRREELPVNLSSSLFLCLETLGEGADIVSFMQFVPCVIKKTTFFTDALSSRARLILKFENSKVDLKNLKVNFTVWAWNFCAQLAYFYTLQLRLGSTPMRGTDFIFVRYFKDTECIITKEYIKYFKVRVLFMIHLLEIIFYLRYDFLFLIIFLKIWLCTIFKNV